MASSDLPDFHIPHAEKIEWMIETNGWALEASPPMSDADPPVPAHAYTIGLPAHVDFPEIIVFGLTPVAANGLLSMVIGALAGGTDLPLDAELVGLLDNGLRCRFAAVLSGERDRWCSTAVSWYRGSDFGLVQLIYPDRTGVLPYESGYDHRMRLAQPVIGEL
jgi:hypothetical protein